jgi:uroporphyrinogen decarboxylase
MEAKCETPRRQVIRAIEFDSPAYVPAWYNYFASETRQKYGERLVDLLSGYQDDVAFAVLSTFPPADEMPPGWTDEWGCSWMRGAVGAVSVNSPLYTSWDRLESYLAEGLPRLGERADLFDRVSRARQAGPETYLVATTWLAVFERLRALRGGENVLTDLYLHPGELGLLRDGVTDAFLAQIRGVAPRGADAVLLADDWGTQHALLVRPEHWRRFFAPCYEQLVAEIHALGMHAWFHSCGHIRPIVPDLIAIGFDVLHPLQPSSLDLAEITHVFGGQICFAGGVDVQAMLPLTGADGVVEAIQRVIDTLDGSEGGFIVAPTNSIMPDTPFENIEAMCRTMRTHGRRRRSGHTVPG